MDSPIGGGAGDNLGALSRSAGFLQGLAGGVNDARKLAHQQKMEEAAALRAAKAQRDAQYGYASIPGAEGKKLFEPQWNEAIPFPIQYGTAEWRNRGMQKRAEADRAARMAELKFKQGGVYDEKEARKTALETIGGTNLAPLLGSDPEFSRNYEASLNSYRQAFGLPPMSLFEYGETQGTLGFGTNQTVKWRPGMAPVAKKAPAAAPAGAPPAPVADPADAFAK